MLYDAVSGLLGDGHSVSIVITSVAAPDYKKNESDFRSLAQSIGARFFLTGTLDKIDMSADADRLDIGISVNWPTVIRKEHIDIFRLGILNLHCGDLPKYRGNACANWAIINGEKEIALSVHLMEGGRLDCGRIITQDRLAVDNNTYIGDVYSWMEGRAPGLILEAVKLLEKDAGYTLKYADPDSPDASRCYPRRAEDGRIDWNDSAISIHRLIRASGRPFAGAYAFVDGLEKIVIWRAEIENDNERYYAVPGQISAIRDGNFTAITGQGKLRIVEWECIRKIKSIRTRLT